MKHLKMTGAAVAFMLGCIGAFATSEKVNVIDTCATIPNNPGPSINTECPYSPTVQCCFISAGSSAQFVTQTQGTNTVMIRRNPSSAVTIFGVRQ